MKAISILVVITLLCLGGCASRLDSARQPLKPEASNELRKFNNQLVAEKEASKQTEKAMAIDAAIDRKIIRNADLTIEVTSTTQAQQQVTQIAETHGGFIVTSEAKQRENSEPAKRTIDVKLIVRVPSPQFNSALSQIESLATNMPQRNVTGQDVTEEFIDLEARIKTQKALELQFLEIMKQATKVADALEVQRQIADVRTEIEKLEGRKRFLANQSSLSTITVNLTTPSPIVVTKSGLGHTLREATSDSLELASGLVLFFVRFVIVSMPVLLFIILPLTLVALYFRRRAQRIRLAAQLEAGASN
jgi:Domain of unknown function (DUF4349)